MKKLYFIVFAVFIFNLCNVNAFAQSNSGEIRDYIPNDCSSFAIEGDDIGLMACTLAKKFQTQIYRTNTAIFYSMIETAPQICGYEIRNKKKFREDKKKLLNTNKMKRLYNFILNNLDYSTTSDNTLHCKDLYKYFKNHYF